MSGAPVDRPWFTRRRLRAALGLLWLAAGVLQLQPFMFTRGFADDVLGTAALSQPAPLHQAIAAVEHLVTMHPAVWNALFAVTELLIGAGLVVGRDGLVARVACRCSLAFGLGVWVVGEGLGGLLTGHAAAATGAPGAALLYCVLTIAAWPRPAPRAAERPPSARLLAASWTFVWLTGAALAVLPSQWGVRGLAVQASMGAMMSPSWTAGSAAGLARWAGGLTPVGAGAISVGLVGAFVAIALGGRGRGGPPVAALVAGVAAASSFWVFGQGLGGMSAGTATDVGTGPLVVLLALTMIHRPRRHRGEPRRASVRS